MYSSAEDVRDSAVSNAGIPSSAFIRHDVLVQESVSVSFLPQEENPNSASIVEQDETGNVMFLSRLSAGGEALGGVPTAGP